MSRPTVPSLSVLDIKNAVNVIGLTMVSGFVGVNAASLPDTSDTAIVLGGTILFLWVFNLGFHNLAEDIYYRRRKSAISKSLALIAMAIVIGIGAGDIFGKPYIWSGIFVGWVLVFLLSVWRGDGHTIEQASWHG